MIQANEFRIGNYCMDKLTKEYLLVDEIVKGNDDNHVIGFFVVNRDKFPLPTGWEAAPIPITPGILEKAGFGYFKGNNSFQLRCDYGITLWGREEIFLYDAEYDAEIGVGCKYLHQLQNLYFALTGTELTINFNS